jgi:hypothetical protein
MDVRCRHAIWSLLVAAAVAGCGHSPAPPAGTGAREAAASFYEALLRQEWERAYAVLHPDSRAQCNAERFTGLARNYRRDLGFEPVSLRVRSCEEQGGQAIAHVVFMGPAGHRQRYYRDALVLRHSGENWGVVLPPRFGKRRTS